MELIKKLSHDKIEINWNSNPVKMDLFMSFITVETEISRDHLGSRNGWTRYINKELNLIIGGGIVGGTEYLDSLQFGIKLQSLYNNYVNPFYLFPIMNNQGKEFFMNYYSEDIKEELAKQKHKIKFHESSIEKETKTLKSMMNELGRFKNNFNN